MSFSEENGYIPVSIESMLDSVRQNVNEQFGTSYTSESFVGTNFYKYFYALIQRLQENEIKTSEIFAKLQQYFEITNERIQRPVATNPGLIEALEKEGYIASVKPMEEEDAGKAFICVDVDDEADDYDDIKLAVATIIKNSIAAGIVTQGDQVESIVLTNGQSFDFKFSLPTKIDIGLKLTLTLSENNQVVIGSPDDVKTKLLAQIAERYRLGRNFEPQRYFERSDAPWTSEVLLEWTDDVTDGEVDMDATYQSIVFDADFDDLFVAALSRLLVVEE